MIRRLACCAVGLLLVATACSGGGDTGAEPDLAAEGDRIAAELTGLDPVTGAEVQVRSGATWGRQVLVDVTTDDADPAGQRVVLEEAARAGWNTTAFVPTDVHATLVGPGGVSLDVRDLGFPHRGADPAGLYELFGAPAADEDWRP